MDMVAIEDTMEDTEDTMVDTGERRKDQLMLSLLLMLGTVPMDMAADTMDMGMDTMEDTVDIEDTGERSNVARSYSAR